MIRALVFDLDDTLFPEREFVLSGFAAVDEWLRGTKAISGFLEKASAGFTAGARGNIFDLVLNDLGVGGDCELIRQMVEVYRNHKPRIRLFADAERALEHFSKTRQLGLLTDGYLNVQRRKVTALSIADQFQAIVYSDVFGRQAWKPSSIPYEHVAKALDCAPSECAYVGDNPAKDFVTARRLNWFTIRVRRPGAEHFNVESDKAHEADKEIASLLELERVLEWHRHNTLSQ